MKAHVWTPLVCVIVFTHPLAGVAHAIGQESSPPGLPVCGKITILKTDAEEFPSLLARFVVRDKAFRPVLGLEASELFAEIDGSPAKVVRVTSAATDDSRVHVALVLDTSGSMRGPYLDASKKAIEEFARRSRRDDPFSLISVARKAKVRLEASVDRSMLGIKLAALKPSGATALYDGLAKAIDVVSATGGRGAVVAMTDGDDNASHISASALQAKSESAGVPVYVVNIGDRFGAPVAALARRSGGEAVSSRTPGDLGTIYRSIAEGMKAEYSATINADSSETNSPVHGVLLRARVPGGESRGRTQALEPAPEAPPDRLPAWYARPEAIAGAALLLANMGLGSVLLARRRRHHVVTHGVTSTGNGCLPIPPRRGLKR